MIMDCSTYSPQGKPLHVIIVWFSFRFGLKSSFCGGNSLIFVLTIIPSLITRSAIVLSLFFILSIFIYWFFRAFNILFLIFLSFICTFIDHSRLAKEYRSEVFYGLNIFLEFAIYLWPAQFQRCFECFVLWMIYPCGGIAQMI